MTSDRRRVMSDWVISVQLEPSEAHLETHFVLERLRALLGECWSNASYSCQKQTLEPHDCAAKMIDCKREANLELELSDVEVG
jgi:hypothetical protein